MPKARKVTEVLPIILTDPILSQHQPCFRLEVQKVNSEETEIIPFSQRASVPKNQIQRILFDHHTVWEKSVPDDSLSQQTIMALLLQLKFNQVIIPTHPNTISDPNADIDANIKQFLIDGYLVIDPDAFQSLSPNFHKDIHKLGLSVRKHLTTKVPQIQHVFSDPTMKKVLTRLLGTDYESLPTTHMHLSQRGRLDQHWHKGKF